MNKVFCDECLHYGGPPNYKCRGIVSRQRIIPDTPITKGNIQSFYDEHCKSKNRHNDCDLYKIKS